MVAQQLTLEHLRDLERNMVSKKGSNLYSIRRPSRAVSGG